MRIRPYEKLIVWQEAHKLCLFIFRTTKSFPSVERFSLTTQMRRSSYSVPMNLAEGNARRSQKEHIHFIHISIGSLEELHYQCRLAHDLGYLKSPGMKTANDHLQRTGYLLQKLRQSLL